VDRCVLALINEGAKLLDEGIALRASDIDVVYLNGYAFPAGGRPMFYATRSAWIACWRGWRNSSSVTARVLEPARY